jgi:obg-like ATPase 1
VPVFDDRFEHLVEKYKPKSVIPAVLGITDIAGLVKGASEGAGLGNEFLSHISAVDGIYHVCRDFANKEVTHVEGSVEPVRDVQIIHEELRLKDSAKIATWIAAEKKFVDRNLGGKEKKDIYNIALKVQKHIDEDKKDVRSGDWNPAEVEFLNTQQFLTAKPMIYLLNVSKSYYEAGRSKFYPEVVEWVKARGNGEKVVVISAEFEMMLLGMPEDERKKYLEEKKLKSVLDKVIIGGYKTLQMIHFFTSGPDEVRAW